MNEWFKYLDDKDLHRDEGYHNMVLTCPKCGALFQEKACGGRTVFTWMGYHPTDGNCMIITDETLNKISSRANRCSEDRLIRVTSVKVLKKLIIDHK